MNIILGTVSSTPSYWVTALSNITLSNLKRISALRREFGEINANPNVQIHNDIPKLRGRTSIEATIDID